MNTPHIVPGVVVAGLAMAAALATANFIRAAEKAAGIPRAAVDVPGQTIPAAPSPLGMPAANDRPGFASPVAAFRGNLDFVSHACPPFLVVDRALILALNPAPHPAEETAGPAAAIVNPSHAVEIAPTGAGSASDAARDQADLDALFAVAVRVKPARVEAAKNAQGERGKRVYLDLCFACHQPDGRGLPGTFPMLAKSDYLAADRTRAIRIVLEGLAGPVTVNGETINSVMPAQKTVLTDQQIADVLTYVFNAWGNPGEAFDANQIEAIRKEKSRN